MKTAQGFAIAVRRSGVWKSKRSGGVAGKSAPLVLYGTVCIVQCTHLNELLPNSYFALVIYYSDELNTTHMF